MQSSRLKSSLGAALPWRPGLNTPEKLTIPPDRFEGLAAVFPEGLRAGAALIVGGRIGSGVSRFCYEILAWWSLLYGFCAVVDLTGRISPAAIAAGGADLSRLIVIKPPSGRLDRLASAIGALIDGFSLTALMADPGKIDRRLIAKAVSRASARKSLVLFVSPGGQLERSGAIPGSIKITLRCKGWSTDRYGALTERCIEASVRGYGPPRKLSLIERAASQRLLSLDGEAGGLRVPRVYPHRASRHDNFSDHEYRGAAVGEA